MESKTDAEAYPITTEATTSDAAGASEESPTKRRKGENADSFAPGKQKQTEEWLNSLAETALNANNKRAAGLTPSASVASFISSFSGYGDEEDEFEEVELGVVGWRAGGEENGLI